MQLSIKKPSLFSVVSLLVVSCLLVGGNVQAQFTTGNVVVLQVGNGIQVLTNTGNSLFLKEFTPAGGTGFSVSIPDVGINACISSGAATSEDQISRSTDGSSILIPGYNASLPYASSLPATTSLAVPRIIGKVNGCGTYSIASSSSTFFNASNIRGAAGNGSTNFWACGANTGLCYLGTGVPSNVSNTVTNERVVQIYNGNLMFSTGSGTPGVYQISGQPTSGPNVASAVVTNVGGSPYGFAIDQSSTTIYMADDRAFTSTGVAQGGIEKYSWNGTAWVFQYTLQCGVGTIGARGLTVDFSGANPIIYATTAEATVNRLIKIVDLNAASGSSALVLSTAPVATAYRSVAFSPIGAPTFSSISSNTPICSGSTLNLSVNVIGSPAFSYSWSGPNGFTSTQQNPILSNATSAAAGIYSVTVTNACGTITQNTSVVVNPSPVGSIFSSTNILCHGNSTGGATIIATGGTPAYSYAWVPSGGTTATASGLVAGNYTCTITDANTCAATVTVAITQPTVLGLSLVMQSDVTCNGGNNGSAFVTVSGGTPSYSYSWLPSGGTAATAVGLTVGNYTCTITDNNSCVITQSFVIVQPTAITATTSQTNNVCYGGNGGSASVNAAGGTPGYTYLWSPSGGTNATANSLAAGNYTCAITDANLCTFNQTFTITQPSAIASINSQINVSCNGNTDGSATVVASGGTPGYTYNWSPSGGTSATANSLSPGNYSCTITDLNGCTSTQTFLITQPISLSATSSQINILCNGGNNGSATVVANGGTPTYTYLWSPSGGNAATATALSAGNYTCTITDANGCSATSTFLITQPTTLTAISTQTNVNCNGGNNGSATVVASGGVAGYSYLWSPSGGTSATASSLSAGNYFCTVTDANGCTFSASVTITQPVVLSLLSSQVNVACNGGSSGSASVIVTGGTPTYTYAWLPTGGTNATATLLTSGNYTCAITDANGCQITQSFIITQPSALSVLPTQVNVLCNTGNSGSASVLVSGGTPSYTYSWAPSGGTGATATSLAVGSYTCTITDANSCSLNQSFVITQPSTLANTASQTDVLCNGGNTGSATVVVSGGNPGYSYSWSPTGGNASNATSLTTGIYSCVITDANGCSLTQTFSITEPNLLTATSSQSNVSCNGNGNGAATVITNGGTPAYSYAWAPSGGNAATASSLTPGNYSCTITDANGCITTQSITITEPSVLAATSSQTNILCYGGNTGAAIVIATGGTASYSYSWTPSGGNAATASSLTAGNYSCTITDANGCSITASVNIVQPTVISVTSTQTDILCNGGNNGMATVNASGGTPTYTYVWSPSGGTSASASSLVAGNYSCIITDANGCTLTPTFTITQPTQISLTVTSSPACGLNNGNAVAIANGGTAPLTFSWNPAAGNSSTISGLSAGNYSCTITDANGCVQSSSVIVLTNANPIAGISTDISIQIGSNTTLSATGGTTYDWNPSTGLNCTNCTNPVAAPVQTTMYCVIVSDANLCSDTACVTVTVDETCPELFVPNVFSPNGDNENDLLCIYGKQCVKTIHFSIFDRWGEKVFETENPNDCWDGTYKGKTLDSAVFVYFLEGMGFDGKQISKKGNITLLR